MKSQILDLLLVFLLRDCSSVLLTFEIRDLIDQLFFAPGQILTSFFAGERFSMELKRVADASKQKRTNDDDDEPRMRTHGIGNVSGSRRTVILREEQ